VRILTQTLKVCSMETIGDRGEQYLVDPGDFPRKGNSKFSSLRPSLDVSFLLDVLCAVTLLLDSLPSARVFPIDGVVWVACDRR
jgi:phage-related protein